jgi:hypothetical protein
LATISLTTGTGNRGVNEIPGLVWLFKELSSFVQLQPDTKPITLIPVPFFLMLPLGTEPKGCVEPTSATQDALGTCVDTQNPHLAINS